MTLDNLTPNTLGLDDDGDNWEIVVELERAFGVKITDAEAQSIVQVGQLYDVLESKLGPASGKKCATAMSFYRLRHAILQDAPFMAVRPDTNLAAVFGSNPKLAIRKLETLSGLRLPRPSLSPIGVCGLLVSALSVCWILFGKFILDLVGLQVPDPSRACLVTGAVALVCGIGLMWLDPMQLAERLATFGDLAMVTAALNYGLLAKAGARQGPEELWDALTEVLSSFRDTLAPRDIHRGTYFLQARFDEAHKIGTLREG